MGQASRTAVTGLQVGETKAVPPLSALNRAVWTLACFSELQISF